MADTAAPQVAISSDPIPTKKPRATRKPLKQKTPSTNEANIVAGEITYPVQQSGSKPAGNENPIVSSSPTKKAAMKVSAKAAGTKQSKPQDSFEKELQEMQERFEQLKIEKQKTDEMLRVKDEMLKLKEEELETRGKEQEKLQIQFKKLQKIKEFKPTMTFPIVQPLRDTEQDKKKKKKGCLDVKRPSPAYILWCKDQWSEIKKGNPEAEFKEISNILGTKWKSVTAEEKKPYEEKYQAEREAYLQIVGKEKREIEAITLLEEEQKQKSAMELLDQYMQFQHEAQMDNKNKTKKEKDPLKPKHPVSAFFVFSSERRPALLAENKSVTEVAKIAGEEWKNMTEKQRIPYEKIAMKNKEKYMQEMEVYKHNKDEETTSLRIEEDEKMKVHKQEALQLLKKKEKADNFIKKTKENRQKKKKMNDPNKPKKPASSFLLFSKEARKTVVEERPGINTSTINALISIKWKEMCEQEKQVWNDKAAGLMEVYKKELEEYKKSVVARGGHGTGRFGIALIPSHPIIIYSGRFGTG